MIIRAAAKRARFSDQKMAKVDLAAGEQLFAGLNCFEPGQEHKLHTHRGQDKLYLVLEGVGDVTVDETTERVGPGDAILAKSEVPHSMANPGPERLVVLAVLAPPPR